MWGAATPLEIGLRKSSFSKVPFRYIIHLCKHETKASGACNLKSPPTIRMSTKHSIA